MAGEPDISINRASVESLAADFLNPPPVQADSRGVLSVHYDHRVYPIPVDEHVGKKTAVGDEWPGHRDR